MPEKIDRSKLYLSTVAADAPETAQDFGLGLEIAEFCTAMNMDEGFATYDPIAREKMRHADRFVLHAPFNELCPSAIDPLVLDIARRRYAQAFQLADGYGIRRMVVHSGYVPLVYFKEYFVERSVEFWRAYLADKPDDFSINIENVLEDEPDMLIDIARGVDDPRFKLCFDIGHANITKNGLDIMEWTQRVVPVLGHAHLHNNYGWPDRHHPLGDGDMDVAAILDLILSGAPEATITIESIEARPSVDWLIDKGYLQ